MTGSMQAAEVAQIQLNIVLSFFMNACNYLIAVKVTTAALE
jgi:hypothetical protein